MKIVAISGWAFQQEIFQFTKKSWKIEKYDFSQWLRMSQKEKVICLNEEEVLLVGWSLGVFLLHSFIPLPKVRGAVFLSAAQTFIKTSDNPYGVKKTILNTMKRKLQHDKPRLLKDFYTKVYHPLKNPVFVKGVNFFSSQHLYRGLIELEKASLQKIPDLKKPVIVLHGKKDRILSWRAGKLWADKFHYDFTLFDQAGHFLPYEAKKELENQLLSIENRIAL